MPRVLQINLQHSRAASAAFCQFFLQEGFDLALIQEPWLHQGRVAGLNETKGKLIYCTSLRNVRTCILLRRGLDFLTLNEFCSRDLTVGTLTWKNGGIVQSTIVGSVYLPYDARELPPSRDLELLVEEAQARRQQLLLGCDANAHHSAGWGSTNTNPRDFLSSHESNRAEWWNIHG
uniref:Endonuclease/exonuclease/phosphatase domain-containing protein n=1 Tax=Homalodisca liturata TaxID=320908 RepID=A0A1B6JMA2_9HEMI